MRVAAILFVIGGALGVYGASQYQIPEGAVPLFPGVTVAVGVFGFVFALIYALVLWGFADGLVLLADVDDAQRATQRELADLLLEQRTARGPFQSERVSGSTPPST
ncbi:MAG: hypothetical protein WEE03_00615 [Chloroflexota bacterium]|nr:hypothetical protein [Candidatus Limnocylindria bacterium]